MNSIRIHLWYDLFCEGVPEDGDGNLLETKVVLNTGKENVDRERERDREKRRREEQRAMKEEKNKGRVLFSYSVFHMEDHESCKSIFSKFKFTTLSPVCFFLSFSLFLALKICIIFRIIF